MKSRPRFYKKAAKKTSIPQESFGLTIDRLSHDGRGIAHRDGKTIFVEGALPGELIQARYTALHGRFDEARCLEIINPSDQRTLPRCRHYAQCGGCELQHLQPGSQLEAKQQLVLDQLRRFSKLTPDHLIQPLTGPSWHYRRRARLGFQVHRKTGDITLGFRRKRSQELLSIMECPILDQRGENLLPALQACLKRLSRPASLSHIELAFGDPTSTRSLSRHDGALICRHPKSLLTEDRDQLAALAKAHQMDLYLQPGGPETLCRHHLEIGAENSTGVGYAEKAQRLYYQLPAHDLSLAFHPGDFTQINGSVNPAMIDLALELLEITPEDRILDLFCGLGNFTLPLARYAAEVVGIEAVEMMVERGRENAETNGLHNVHFHAADLAQDCSHHPWFRQGFNKIVLDPPRGGALEVIRQLAAYDADRILYISCNPATLARDAGELAAQNYRLSKLGVMDMFPQTMHVESIALFER